MPLLGRRCNLFCRSELFVVLGNFAKVILVVDHRAASLRFAPVRGVRVGMHRMDDRAVAHVDRATGS